MTSGMSQAHPLSTPSDAKQFHVCVRCPYYCRAEEGIHRCPWCRITLRRACDCGAPIGDPSDPECPHCRGWLRDPALLKRLRPADPAPRTEMTARHPGSGADLRRRRTG
jgi:hypothetical protein